MKGGMVREMAWGLKMVGVIDSGDVGAEGKSRGFEGGFSNVVHHNIPHDYFK